MVWLQVGAIFHTWRKELPGPTFSPKTGEVIFHFPPTAPYHYSSPICSFSKKQSGKRSCHSLPFWQFLKANQPLIHKIKIRSFPWPKSNPRCKDSINCAVCDLVWKRSTHLRRLKPTDAERQGRRFFAESWSGKDLQSGFGDCDFVETLCNMGITVDMTQWQVLNIKIQRPSHVLGSGMYTWSIWNSPTCNKIDPHPKVFYEVRSLEVPITFATLYTQNKYRNALTCVSLHVYIICKTYTFALMYIHTLAYLFCFYIYIYMWMSVYMVYDSGYL